MISTRGFDFAPFGVELRDSILDERQRRTYSNTREK